MRASTSNITAAVLTVVGAACGSPGEQQLSLFQSAVADRPGDADSHAWVAETARRLRRFGLVENETEAALEIDPCNSFAFRGLRVSSLPGHIGGCLPKQTHAM